jgi:DNA invertase Pin-like site-specific DNA recombinase
MSSERRRTLMTRRTASKAEAIQKAIDLAILQVEVGYPEETIIETLQWIRSFAPKADHGKTHRKGRKTSKPKEELRRKIIELHLTTELSQTEIATELACHHMTVNTVINEWHKKQEENREDYSWGLL